MEDVTIDCRDRLSMSELTNMASRRVAKLAFTADE